MKQNRWPAAGVVGCLLAVLLTIGVLVAGLILEPRTVGAGAGLGAVVGLLGVLLGDRERRWQRVLTYRVDRLTRRETLVGTTPWRRVGDAFVTPVSAGLLAGAVLGWGVSSVLVLGKRLPEASVPRGLPVSCLAFQPPGARLVSGVDGWDSGETWSVADGTRADGFGRASWVAFDETGRRVALGRRDRVEVRDTAGAGVLAELVPAQREGAAGAFEAIAFARDGSVLCAVESGARIRMLEVESGRAWTALEASGSDGVVTEACVAPGLLAVAVREGQEVHVVEVPSGRELVRLRADAAAGWRTGMTFDPAGARLAWGSAGGGLLLIDVRVGASPRPVPSAGRVTALAFSADGMRLASGSAEGDVLVWNPVSGELVSRLGRHAAEVTAVAFSVDGSRVASGDSSGIVMLWDLRAGRRIWRSLPRKAGP
jgi:WD40 repeat protein